MDKCTTRSNILDHASLDVLFDRLYPLCRSIMGKGIRDSMDILKEYIPFEWSIFYTGEKVLNWSIPQEWVIRDAWIKDESGNKIVDFSRQNLHVYNYSEPVDAYVSLDELKQHVSTYPLLPDAIPYAITYYKKRWGFCMSSNQLDTLKDQRYHVYINSEFIDGELRVGHYVLPGSTKKEIILTSYLCHPSMANNELSGPLVLTQLYNKLSAWDSRRFTYRFIINPETIGSIAYLSRYDEELKNMYGGMVLTCLGGRGELRYKRSRQGNSLFDRLISSLDGSRGFRFRITDFDPTTGSDERQYCSPGYNLPVGQMARLVYGEYPEYHTSLDTKQLMGIDNIIDSANKLEEILWANEINGYYINQFPYGEIKLGDYDLYPSLNDRTLRDTDDSAIDNRKFVEQVMTILNYCDGKHELMDIVKGRSWTLRSVKYVVDILIQKGLLKGPFFKEEL